MVKKIKYWFFIIVLTLSFIAGSIAIVELYCAYSYYRYRDTLKNSLNAIRLKEPIHNQKNGDFKTDSSGFILPFTPLEFTSKTIAFMGGSTTECRAVSEDHRVHVEVEKQNLDATCLNIGNSGNHSMHTLDIFANKIAAYKPNVVVINHNINDLIVLLNLGTYFNNHPSRSLLLTSSEQLYSYKVGYPGNWFVRNFIPHISLVLLPTTFLGSGESIQNKEFSEEQLNDDLDVNNLKKIYKNSIKGLVKYCKSWDANVVLMTQGSCFKHYKINKSENYKGYNLDSIHNVFNEVIREVSDETKVSLVDAERLMEDKKSFFHDTVHYTDSGSVFIAKYISETVKSLLN